MRTSKRIPLPNLKTVPLSVQVDLEDSVVECYQEVKRLAAKPQVDSESVFADELRREHNTRVVQATNALVAAFYALKRNVDVRISYSSPEDVYATVCGGNGRSNTAAAFAA